jgi:hypothetical protein
MPNWKAKSRRPAACAKCGANHLQRRAYYSPDSPNTVVIKQLVLANDRHVLSLSLGDEHAIKRVSVGSLEKSGADGVMGGNWQLGESLAVQFPVKICHERTRFELASLALDRDFPCGHGRYEDSRFLILNDIASAT